MKYKCLVCGQIIDNNEMCPFCGSDSSQITPLDGSSAKKGHYRCLVCGRETDNGEYCPYCGSQRLYNLDTNKSEDTQSLDIQNDEPKEVEPVFEEHHEEPHEEVEHASFGAEQEKTEEPIENSTEEEVPQEETKPEESLESRYFNMFGELLPLESIEDPDPNKVSALYRMGINRGEKITPDEIANAFVTEEDNEEPIEKLEEDVKDNEETSIEDSQEEEEEPVINDKSESLQLKVLRTVEDLLHNYDEDSVTTGVLNDLKDRTLDELNSKKSNEELEDEIISLLTKLVAYDKSIHSPSLASDEKYLKLLSILFEKE